MTPCQLPLELQSIVTGASTSIADRMSITFSQSCKLSGVETGIHIGKLYLR
jgi:hypothetical protein